jgi:23S rRNA pseudouridine1911/1915/1917 synthase
VKTVAAASGSILEVLQLLVPGASRRTLRQMLSQGRVNVNGIPCSISSHPIRPGDVLEIGTRRIAAKLPDGLKILYEDSEILVIHKPSGLLTVSTQHERRQTAYALLRLHLKENNPRQKLYVVHRLDKFASGVLVFAKSERVRSVLKSLFHDHKIQRKYWAIVEGRIEKSRGTIRSYLAQDRSHRMHSTDNPKRGKSAVTHFRVIRRLPRVTTLEVVLETGRKNQIRAHLSEKGHPIVGDRAYGSKEDPLGRLGLHAFHLGFAHPAKGTPVQFQAEPPPEFLRYLP